MQIASEGGMRHPACLASFVALALCTSTCSFVVPATAPGYSAAKYVAPSRYGNRPVHEGYNAAKARDARSNPRTTRSSRGLIAHEYGAFARDRLRTRAAMCMINVAADSNGSGDSTAPTPSCVVSTTAASSRVVTATPDSAGMYVVAAGRAREAAVSVETGREFSSGAVAAAVVVGSGPTERGLLSLSSRPTAPARTEIPTDVAVVGAPQKVVEKEYSIEAILKELAEIQNQGPKNYCVLGTRHCSFLHQQIIELLAYALVLSGNHVFTSGAMGTNAATIRGALRAERKELLTVVLPQSLEKQSEGSRELIQKVTNVITNPQNDHLPLDAASRLCNSDLLKRTEQLICFAFHDSHTIIETSKEARSANMIVTDLYLD